MQEKEFVIVPPSPVDTSNFPLITDLQFLEPFGSESLNRKFFGITPPGIYRGFKAELPGGMVLRIGRAGEAGTAIVELNNEHCLTIQQRHPVDLQVSAGFSGFVVLEGFYKFGVPTAQVDTASAIEAARILLVRQPEIRPDHVTLYSLNVPAGATALTGAMLSTEHRNDVAIAGPEAALVSERLEQHKLSRDHPDASETAKGFSRFGTQSEINETAEAKRKSDVVVTAKTLWGWVKQASETISGMMRVASQDQVVAGDADDVVVTPKKLRMGFAMKLGQTGYFSCPVWLGSFIFQWGIMSPPVSVLGGIRADITFPIAFPNAVYVVTYSSGVEIGNLDVNPEYRLCRQGMTLAQPTLTGISAQVFVDNYPTHSRIFYWKCLGR
ncbi:gp53-like domain-containing protein [Aeromonas hydrophila]|uniref:gp53-like domain-containing protein n=1 Tax=Aeromonas hydrophila TaxID=644 RepID=UPI003D1B713B